VGFDVGSEAELYLYRAYVWGPPGDGWERQARWQVRVRDPYGVDGGIWSTAPSPVPWPRADQAADVFGRSTTGPPSTFRLLSDPLHHVALLIVTLRGSMDLFLLEEGRAIVRIDTRGSPGVVTGFATAKSRVYVGALAENRAFRIFTVEAGGLTLLKELPDVTARPEPPSLAPSLHGDALGLWVHSVHHYLYPFDPGRGTLDRPIEVSAELLSRLPEPCTSGEDGYVVGDALSLEPTFDIGVDHSVRLSNGAEARLVVSSSRVCVEGVVAPGGPALGGDDARSPAPSRLGRVVRGGARPGTSGRAAPSRGEADGDPRRSSAGGAGRALAPPAGPPVPLVVNFPDGSRESFRCRD
jgi:hypothetical protein